MAEAVKTQHTAILLQAIYKNVKMASDSILNLMPKVTDEKLKSDMTVQLSAYEAFASRAAKLLGEEGVKPTEEGVITKTMAKMGMAMNTMRDSTSSHLAEMLVEGATMGVNDMLKQIRESENTTASESALRLARDVCKYEEKTIEDIKNAYLRG
ncbi:MAG: hypothetical protein IJW29_01075 [Clostridia bacterium]|nr:hypothetical protein [Clostridia bacterium]